MNHLSIYPYSLTANVDLLLSALQKHFDVFTVTSVAELRDLLKKHAFFCNLIAGNVHEASDLLDIRKSCSAFPRIPCVFYGKVSDRKLVFQLPEAGVNHFVENANTEQLIEKLQMLEAQAMFRIDLRDFGIDSANCSNLWSRKFLKLSIEKNNFLKYKTVNEIAAALRTSASNLDHALKNDVWLPPKQILLCLKNYYAAYLLSTTQWPTKEIAERCGFNNVRDFYKSFHYKTGLTAKTFRNSFHWRDYPTNYIKNMNKKSQKQTGH